MDPTPHECYIPYESLTMKVQSYLVGPEKKVIKTVIRFYDDAEIFNGLWAGVNDAETGEPVCFTEIGYE